MTGQAYIFTHIQFLRMFCHDFYKKNPAKTSKGIIICSFRPGIPPWLLTLHSYGVSVALSRLGGLERRLARGGEAVPNEGGAEGPARRRRRPEEAPRTPHAGRERHRERYERSTRSRPSHSTRACRCRMEARASTTDYEWPVRGRALHQNNRLKQ